MMLNAERLRKLSTLEDTGGPFAEPPPSIAWCDTTLNSLTQLLTAEMAAPSQSALFTDTLVLAIEIHLLRRKARQMAQRSQGGVAPHALRRVTDYLMAHLAEDVALAELAELADLSPHHFCRAFKQSTGLPPHAWLTARRIERAQEMMTTHPEMGLTEIALSTGYASQAAFGVAFKRVAGVTPGQWRRERLR